jgi:RND superfamily putative drug exporter
LLERLADGFALRTEQVQAARALACVWLVWRARAARRRRLERLAVKQEPPAVSVAALIDATYLPWAALIVVAVTLIALFVMTGSVLLPIKAVIMNVLTLGATLGVLVLIFQDGRLEGFLQYDSQGAVDLTQPILIGALAFGLSTDYAVFLLSRIKEIRDNGGGERESVALGLQRTGRVVTAAALLFCIAMGAFATSRIVIIKELGIGTALAVALDATVVRALLVPSLMALLGKWNWWAPKPLRKLHERIGVREGG